MDEFDASPHPNLQHPRALRLLRPGNSERAMCEQYRASPLGSDSLQCYPLIFIEFQVLAASGQDETPVEQLHSMVHVFVDGPAQGFKPATICAYLRHADVMTMLKEPAFERFFRREWPKFLWERLLRPILGQGPLPRCLPERHGVVYSFSVERLHPDVAEESATHAAWEAMRKSKRMKPRPAPPAEVAVLDWLKTHLSPGQVVSVPEHLFEMATAPSAEAPVLEELATIVEYIAPLADTPPPAIHLDGLSFFKVVDPRPEAQVYVEQSHIARHTDVMEVQGMTASPAAGGAFIHLAPDPHGGKTIWLSKWCDKEVLKDVLASTQIWETEVARGSRQITLPTPPTTALPATICPPVADDLVLPFSADAPALAIVPLENQGEDRHCWTRTLEDDKFTHT